MIPFLIVLFALAAGLLSAYQYIKQERAEVDAAKKAVKLIEAQIKLDFAQQHLIDEQAKANDALSKLNAAQELSNEAQKDLIEAQKKIDNLQSKTIEKSDKIIKDVELITEDLRVKTEDLKKIIGSLLGEGSSPHVILHEVIKETSQADIYFDNYGENSAYDLQGEITCENESESFGPMTVNVKGPSQHIKIKITNPSNFRLFISMTSRLGQYRQQIYVRDIGGRHVVAYKIDFVDHRFLGTKTNTYRHREFPIEGTYAENVSAFPIGEHREF